jgi:Cu-Zn family superoxide dismutase
MHVRLAAALTALTLPIAGCTTVAGLPTGQIGTATLTLANGQPAGVARIFATGQEVTLAAGLTGIAPGVHGIHLHTTGRCTAPDFASAGGHLNPLGKRHGSLADGGKHEGDLPNVTIQSEGSGALTAALSGTPDQVRAWLFDADGTAIVVHAGPDDYETDPSGNSGARIACGVIKPA